MRASAEARNPVPDQDGTHVDDREENERSPAEEAAAELSLRAVMACFPTGVTVVATLDEAGIPIGLTVNSFTSVSLEPPLVLVCIDRDSSSHDRLVAAEGFAISILSGVQADLAERFAKRPPQGRFEGVEWNTAPSGNPVLAGAVAWLDCSVQSVVVAGDHSIVLGRATAYASTEASPLLFHRGELGSVGR